MRALGLDLGSRRVGVAVCDPAGKVAVPVETLYRSRSRRSSSRGSRSRATFETDGSGRPGDLVDAVAELVKEREVEVVVVGLPLSLSGLEKSAAAAASAEIRRLRRSLRVPVVAWDERLTTKIAAQQLSAQGLTSRRQRSVIDQQAASVILQSWLDAGMPMQGSQT